MPRIWVIEDIKIGIGGGKPESVMALPFVGSQTQAEAAVRKRMQDHYKSKTVEGVRLLDGGGDEVFRWDYWKERARVQMASENNRQNES